MGVGFITLINPKKIFYSYLGEIKMVKAKISYKRKKSLKSTQNTKHKWKIKKGAPVSEMSATERLLDEDFISKAIWECLKNNDPEGVVEIIKIHMEVVNKVKAAKEMDISRSTIYHSFKSKNPTVKTLAKLVSCCL